MVEKENSEELSCLLASQDSDEPKYLFDGDKFWLTNNSGKWVSLRERSFRKQLLSIGRCPKAQEGETLSEIDRIVIDVELNHRVDWCGPLAGHWSGVKSIAGSNVLITEDPKLIEPMEPDENAPQFLLSESLGFAKGWPLVGEYLRNLLECPKTGDKQLWQMFSYLKPTLECLYYRKWAKSTAMLIAGERECGKTLLLNIVRELFGGKEGQPFNWMIGRDGFNGELVTKVLLTVDDEVSDTRWNARRNFGDRLKKIVATDLQWIRGMHKQAMELKPLWRVFVCANDEPEKLLVFPALAKDNVDKFNMLKAYRKPMPMPASTIQEQEAFWEAILQELPYLVYWLLNEFEIPREIRGRFGALAWQHPDIVTELHELSQESQTWFLIAKSIFTGESRDYIHPRTKENLSGEFWVGSAMDLYTEMIDAERSDGRRLLTNDEAKSLRNPNRLAKQLAKLMEMYPDHIEHYHLEKGNVWVLSPTESRS